MFARLVSSTCLLRSLIHEAREPEFGLYHAFEPNGGIVNKTCFGVNLGNGIDRWDKWVDMTDG